MDGVHVALWWLGELIIALFDRYPGPSSSDSHGVFHHVSPAFARFVASEVQGLTLRSPWYVDPPDHPGESFRYVTAQVLPLGDLTIVSMCHGN